MWVNSKEKLEREPSKSVTHFAFKIKLLFCSLSVCRLRFVIIALFRNSSRFFRLLREMYKSDEAFHSQRKLIFYIQQQQW